MHFSHANAIFSLFSMFSHHFEVKKEKKGEKSGENTVQAKAGSHPKAGLTPLSNTLLKSTKGTTTPAEQTTPYRRPDLLGQESSPPTEQQLGAKAYPLPNLI